jgi:hypothetical protein
MTHSAEHDDCNATTDGSIAVNRSQVALAQAAAAGDAQARATINREIQSIIDFQNSRFCKRFCHNNRYHHKCTLDEAWNRAPSDATLCEWGNAGYAWMLEDLTSSKRLQTFTGKGGARLFDYIYRIANSLPFYERWKDWRFGRKLHVPTYVQNLDPLAGQVFYALREGNNPQLIAQKLCISETRAEGLCHEIIIVLTQKNRLHLLDPPKTVALSDLNKDDATNTTNADADLPSFDLTPEQREDIERLKFAWQKLAAVEQYVLEAMVIEEQDANDVLTALSKLGISLQDGVAAGETNRQQLYYFRRKTIAKLANLVNEA